MKRIVVVVFAAVSLVAALGICSMQASESAEELLAKPVYAVQGDLLRPTDYRDWEFLSAGFGMNYGPKPDSQPRFTNVFVQPWAYREFLRSGKWPEETMFVIDERDAQSKGSINNAGHYQAASMGLALEIKDSKRNPQIWTYFEFDAAAKAARAEPKGNACWTCHEAHAAVEHSFVQFYPTLIPVAKKFGVYDARKARQELP